MRWVLGAPIQRLDWKIPRSISHWSFMVLFRQLIDQATSTFTYLLADEVSRRAVLIDCVFEQHRRDLALIVELGLRLEMTLETHLHADHVTGAWLMQQAVGSRIGVPRGAGTEGHDRELDAGDVLDFGALQIEVRATPGHTDACLSYVLIEPRLVFTGDSLQIRGAGRTDFQHGDSRVLFRSVREQLFSLPEDTVVHPGHDYSGRCSSTIGEERRFNPRLGDGVREQDFVGYMANLGLPHPARLARAIPGNLRCGRPDGGVPPLPEWAPLTPTYAGIWQIEPEWVFANCAHLTIVDVREAGELDGDSLGRIPEALSVPLSVLRHHVDDVPRERPVALVCPTGARSAMAASILEDHGFERVANVRGGLVEWRALGLPVEAAHTP